MDENYPNEQIIVTEFVEQKSHTLQIPIDPLVMLHSEHDVPEFPFLALSEQLLQFVTLLTVEQPVQDFPSKFIDASKLLVLLQVVV